LTGGSTLAAADSPLTFAPREGPAFFEPSGLTPLEARSLLRIGAKLRRLFLMMRLFSLLPDHGAASPISRGGGTQAAVRVAGNSLSHAATVGVSNGRESGSRV